MSQAASPGEAKKPGRPRPVTLVAFGVLTIAGLYTARLLLALARWQDLNSFSGVSPLYIAITGLVWTGCAWPLTWGLWRGRPWAPRWARLAGLVYTVYYWLDRLGIAARQAGSLPVNFLFAAGLNLTCIGLLYWGLSMKKSRAFFGETDERPS